MKLPKLCIICYSSFSLVKYEECLVVDNFKTWTFPKIIKNIKCGIGGLIEKMHG